MVCVYLCSSDNITCMARSIIGPEITMSVILMLQSFFHGYCRVTRIENNEHIKGFLL